MINLESGAIVDAAEGMFEREAVLWTAMHSGIDMGKRHCWNQNMTAFTAFQYNR